MNSGRDYNSKVMEDLDALLDELQLTTAHISNKQPSSERISVSSSRSGQSYQPTVNQGGRSSQTPPPLPPPPQDIPEAIPPPQQFGDQPLYEAQNVKGDYRVSGSSQSSSRGSGEQQYYYRDKTSPGQYQSVTHQQQQHQYPPPPPQQQHRQQQQYTPQSPQQYQPAQQQQQHQQQYQPPNQQYQPSLQGGRQEPYQSPQQQYPPPQQQYPPPQQTYPPAQQEPQQGMSMISNNLSELDQLLNDLNSAQFLAEVDKKHKAPEKVPPPVAKKPTRGGPSVDNLLDQLESSVPSSAGPHGGYPVQQDGTAVNNYTYQSLPEENGSVSNSHSSAASQSAATQELDSLMATLSDFKVQDKSGQGQVNMPPPPRSPSPGSEPSYAKPHKSRNLSQSSSMNSSLQSSSMTGNMSNSSNQGGQLETMLGDLQSDMNKQGVNTKTKGLCAACNQPVVGQVITALGKIWHIEHFMCAHCHEPLGTKNFYERDNQAFCETDYHSLFAPRCSYCNGPIVDKCVTALNKTWHPEHFFCTLCGRPFGEDGFHEKDGKAYCKADFFEVFAPKCGGCARAIVDNYITALNRHWHPECFACWECRQPFGGSSFFDYEGLPYCENHYHAKRGSLCAGCQKPIAGRCITAMYKKFHPEHFVCAFCLKQLNKGTFKEQNDRPYCHPCFVKLFG